MLYGKTGIHSIVIFKPFAVHEACGTLCRVTGGVGPRPLSWWCCFVRRADTQICQGICFSVSSLAFLVFCPFVCCLFLVLFLPHRSSTTVQFDPIVDFVFSLFHLYIQYVFFFSGLGWFSSVARYKGPSH